MRKLILSLVLVFSANTFFAQSVFDKFEDQEGITAVVVNKKMFSLLRRIWGKSLSQTCLWKNHFFIQAVLGENSTHSKFKATEKYEFEILSSFS